MNSKKPSKIWFALAGGILFLGIIIIFLMFVLGISTAINGDSFVCPGSSSLNIPNAGKYKIMYEHGIIPENEALNDLIFTIKNKSTGELISLTKVENGSSYTMNAKRGIIIYEFEVEKSGDYEFTTSFQNSDKFQNKKLIFKLVSDNKAKKALIGIFIAIIIGIISFLIAFIIILITIIRIINYNKKTRQINGDM